MAALCLAVYLPGLWSIPVVDRDEARFAQASRQMVESGDFVVPRVQDRDRLNKPPLIYWLHSVSLAVFGDEGSAHGGIWVYRLVSVVGAVAAVLLTWRLGLLMFDGRAAVLGSALLAVCPMVVWDANQARADQVLLAACVLAQLGLWRVWRAGTSGRSDGLGAAMLWVGIGLGVLTKGPITPMVVVLSGAALGVVSGRWGWLRAARPGIGVLIVAAMVAPWVVLVAWRVGFGEYAGVVFDEVLGRSAAPMEGHWGPPGYHLVLLAVLFWPGSLLTAAGFVRAWRRGVRFGGSGGGLFQRLGGRSAGRAGELFCVAWIVPAWVVFELVNTKLPHYTLPLYPAVALVSARAVLACASGRLREFSGRGGVVGYMVWCVIGVVIVVGAPVGLGWFVGVLTEGVLVMAGALGVGVAVWLAAAGWREIRRGGDGVVWVQAGSVGCAVLAVVLLLGVMLPRAEPVWVTTGVVRVLEGADPGGERALAAVGYHEDSLVFMTRGRVERIDEGELDGWIERNPGGLVVLPVELGFVRARLLYRGEVEGFNYSTGRRVRLVIAEVADPDTEGGFRRERIMRLGPEAGERGGIEFCIVRG